jgi:hypothetical protein
MKSYLAAALVATLGFGIVNSAKADVQDRLYEFRDSYYKKFGVDPATINGRRQADGFLAVEDTPIFAYQRNVRALFTLGAWSDGGKPLFFTVFGGLSGNSFSKDDLGTRTRQMADASPEYVFPMRGTDPLSLRSVRQPFMLDMRNGFLSNNKLGIWLHVFVNWTDRAFNTSGGQKALSDLAKRNGVGNDGTPFIRTASELDNLFSKGYVSKSTLPFENPDRYGICPVIKDPTDGGIAKDQWLSTTKFPDGTPHDPLIVKTFESLRLTGR